MSIVHWMTKRRFNHIDSIGIGMMWALFSHHHYWSAAICFIVTAVFSGVSEAVANASPAGRSEG